VARRKKNLVRKSRTGNNVAGRTLRERTPRKRRQVDPEGNTRIKDPGATWQLCLRNEKTAGRISWKTHEKMFKLETAKRIAGSPVHYKKARSGHCEGVDPLRSVMWGHQLLWIVSPHNWNMIDHLDELLPYQSAAWDER
jgi:hypothetical protein